MDDEPLEFECPAEFHTWRPHEVHLRDSGASILFKCAVCEAITYRAGRDGL